jgi:hypothetical protein
MRQGGVSAVVTATWVSSGAVITGTTILTTSVYMEPVKFECHFEDKQGNTITNVNRDYGEICWAVAELKCDFGGGGVHGVPILFTAEKGKFLDDGVFLSTITIPTDPHGKASAELWSGVCETGSGSTVVTAELGANDPRFCTAGNLSNTACTIDFIGTTGDPDPLCLTVDLDYTEQDCRDDPRRTFITATAQVTNDLTGNAVGGVLVLFTMLSDGGLSLSVDDCRPIPPPQCNNTEVLTMTTVGGIATVQGYVCTYGQADLKMMACVIEVPIGDCDTITATGIGLQEGL